MFKKIIDFFFGQKQEFNSSDLEFDDVNNLEVLEVYDGEEEEKERED
jgi:hypothetical protein